MRYNELPKWAQEKAKETYKKWALQNIKEAREAGENVSDYADEELEEYVMSSLNDKDDFEIEYDEDGQNPVLGF